MPPIRASHSSIYRITASLWVCSALPAFAHSAEAPSYLKLQLSDQFFSEGSTFGDFDNDGHVDAAAGPYWYAGPDFQKRFELYAPAPFDPLQYSDNFLAFSHDFNRDGWADILVLGFPGKTAIWYQNPQSRSGPWMPHVVFDGVDNESPTFGDLLGTGQPVLICNHQSQMGYATFDPSAPEEPWTFHAVSPPGPWQRFTHGLGFGDVNGDGRADLIAKEGWWEQPESLKNEPLWKHHPADFGPGGAQMYATDINGDGLPDVVTARQAHGYGLSWFEQSRGADGAATFIEHAITGSKAEDRINGIQFSQPHAIDLADMDGDGMLDIVTGKRWWAHGPDKDPEPNAPAVIYAFLVRRGQDGSVTFEPHLIDDASGVGTQLVTADANDDGTPDIVSANKRGTFIFLSE